MTSSLTVGRVCLTYALCALITIQPVLANVVIDTSSSNTSRDEAANGVEIINIATPNEKGLSHNRYQQFNVDPSGLVLNNATAQLSQSQLAGLVQNNPNLTGGQAAKVILNEVIGANRSQLQGYTEVLGEQAHVILANPYGITCDGCGFINTPRVTISTGVPEIEAGQVTGFDVTQGNIMVEGLGLDASQQDYFDIISRTATLNANLHAQDLTLITGQNKVSYQDQKVSVRERKPVSSDKPALAIDSSSLGGMYAGRIALVATEEGVGINLGPLASSQGDVQLSADGKITVRQISSQSSIHIETPKELEVRGDQLAKADIHFDGDRVNIISAEAVAGDSLEVEASHLTLLNGQLSAERIKADARDIQLDTSSGFNSHETHLKNIKKLSNQGTISATDTFALNGQDVTLQGQGSINSDQVTVQAGALGIDTQVRAGSAEIKALSTLNVAPTALVSAKKKAALTGSNVTIQGQVIAGEDLSVSATNMTLKGGLSSVGDIAVVGDKLGIEGKVNANQTATLKAKQRFDTVQGSHLAALNTLVLEAKDLHIGGDSHRAKKIHIDADKVTNHRRLSAEDALTVNAGQLDNHGEITAEGQLNFMLARDMTNRSGALINGQNSQINANHVENQGHLQAIGNLGLTVGSLTNSGSLIAMADQTLQVAGATINHGVIYAGGSAQLFSRTFDNYADVLANQNVTIGQNAHNEKNQRILNSSGTIEAINGDLALFSHSILNQRTTLDVETSYSEDKRAEYTEIYGGKVIRAVTGRECRDKNNRGGAPECSDVYSVVGGTQFSVLAFKESVLLKSASVASRLLAGENLVIGAGTVLNNASQIAAKNITITADQLTNRGYDFSSHATYYDYEYAPGNRVSRGDPFRRTTIRRTHTGNLGQLNSSISAQATLNLNVASQTNNSTIRSSSSGNHGQVVPPALKAVNTNGPDIKIIDPTNDVPSPRYTIPTNPNGLFVQSPDPQARFFIETRGIYVDPSLFLGSDYFMSRIKFDPSRDIKFLGDAFYDTRLISQAIFEQTGQRYLSNEIGSDFAQMQTLMNAAAKQQSVMKLALGVSLTKEQVANLTDDIVWYERIKVNGQEVLAPKLYLAKATREKMHRGAQITGSDSHIVTGQFESSGVVSGNQSLSIKSDKALVNRGGVIEGGKLSLEANDDVVNKSGKVTGDTVSLVSHKGNVINETQFKTLSATGSGGVGQFTEVGKQASIQARDKLDIRAAKNIASRAASISGNGVTLNAGESVVLESKAERHGYGIGTQKLSRKETTRQWVSTLDSGGALNITAGENIALKALQLNAQADVEMKAGKDVEITAQSNQQSGLTTLGHWSHQRTSDSTRNVGADLKSGGAMSIVAGRNVTLTGSKAAANDSMSVTAGGNVTLQSSQDTYANHTQAGGYTEINRGIVHQGSSLSGDKVTIDSQKDVQLLGSTILADQSVDIAAKGDVSVLAVNDSHYHFDRTVTRKSFGRGSTTTNESYQETVKGSSIEAGQDIEIKAQNIKNPLTAKGQSDINVVGSSLSAEGAVKLVADGDVNLKAQDYRRFSRHETTKRGFGGLSSSQSGQANDATLLSSSYLINSGDTQITSGRDIGVIASEIITQGEVNLEALDEVLIAAGEVVTQSEKWHQESSFFSGGDIYSQSFDLEGEAHTTAAQSQVQSGGGLNVSAGSIKVVGSTLAAGESATLTADTGQIDILAAKESHTTYKENEKLSVSIGDFVTDLLDMGKMSDTVENGKLKIKLADATYDKVDSRTDETTHQGSSLAANRDITIDAVSDINIEGASLVADANANQSGDLLLKAGDSVRITDVVDSRTTHTEETHGKAEVSAVVQHQAVEVAKAAQALQASTKALKQAKNDYRQYKKQLDKLSTTLSTLEQELADKKPGVTQADIIELKGLIADVKADEEWYIGGIALATVDVTSKTTALTQQTAAAAQSTATWGFNAGIQLDIDASKTQTQSQQTTSQASQLTGNNIRIQAGSEKGDVATVKGSHLVATDSLSIAANEVNLLAAKETHQSSSNIKTVSGSAQVTAYGANSGMSVNLNGSERESRSSSTTHINSTLAADNIAITSNADTTVRGANVNAQSELALNVGGDLMVESVQDRHSSQDKSRGVSAGISLGGSEGNVTGASGGLNAGSGRTYQTKTLLTSLTAGDTANINVDGHTQLNGALIASVDKEGKGTGNLTLETESLGFSDLKNTTYTQNSAMGISTGVGIGNETDVDGKTTDNTEVDSTYNSSILQYQNSSDYSVTKTLATVGQGHVTVGGDSNSDSLTALNRDAENTEKDLFSVERNEGNVDVTVDHRLLTEAGRNAIAEDVTTVKEKVGDVAFDIGAKDLSKALYNVDDPKIAEALKGKAESTLDRMIEEGVDPALAKQLLTDPDLYEIASNIMHAYDPKAEETHAVDNTVSTNKSHVPGEKHEITITHGRHLNAPEKVLDGLDSAQKYVSTLPTEQAEAALIAVSLLTGGVVKVAIDMAKDTVVDTAFGDFLEEVKHEAGKEIVAKVSGISVLQHEDDLAIEKEIEFEGYSTKFQNGAEFGLSVIGIGASLGAGSKLAKSKGDNHTQQGDLDFTVPEGSLPNPNAPRDEFTGAQNSATIRANLEATHGADNVQSTTVVHNPRQTVNSNPQKNIELIRDSYGNKAVRVEYKDPVTAESKVANIAYDSQRGLPVFDDHAKYTTNIKKPDGYENMSSQSRKRAEMRAATRDLRDKINNGTVDKSEFTSAQLREINAGSEAIPGYTWHHNAQSSPNNMQLIPRDVHNAAKHIGEASLSEGR
ncbi:hemagglutinin repeat-containing protein [Vibrio caribbeanicus]|uniref:two-partner secretion domain-containing protein n=1 Tax=Vibrio caribbeanicus TaxID=701175 RepID=UPI002284EB90|nr:hemagglutinin repeat-containing protein [Vibrio caribbeanicus]MCY9846361.1 hemagglutinin repeat-containing protein [Vibrio caribbeanicus]